jgi:hypothetical protein
MACGGTALALSHINTLDLLPIFEETFFFVEVDLQTQFFFRIFAHQKSWYTKLFLFKVTQKY